MLRIARIVASVACVTLSISLMALWVLSFFWRDTASYDGLSHYKFANSVSGHLEIGCDWSRRPRRSKPIQYWRVGFATISAKRFHKLESFRGQNPIDLTGRYGFNYIPLVKGGLLVLPHWLPVLVAGALAFALKRKPRWRFSIAHLLGITTVAAALFGTFAILARLS